MYTELIFGAQLKPETPKQVIDSLKYILGEIKERPENFELPEGRCEWLLRGSSHYFGVSSSVSKMWYDEIGENYVISTRSSIKNYGREIEKFLAWIKPYIESGSGENDIYAYVLYEEDDSPTIYSLR